MDTTIDILVLKYKIPTDFEFDKSTKLNAP